MSLTRKASSAAKMPIKPPRQDLAAALAERDAELAEARGRQTATAEILRVISQSPTDPQPVFESIVAAAARLLGCDMAAVLLRDGDVYVHTAGATPEGPMPDLAPIRVPIDASANFPSRAFLTKTMVHLPDWSLIDLPEHERHVRDAFGVNSALFLPLLRDDACIAVLVFIGKQANAFGPGEIAQAESFRDQALIAIENARLFREAQEALEQQKASAEVLGAISKSIADASPVFETILDACQRLFGSEELGIYTIGDDQMVRAAAWRGPRAEEARQDVTPLPDSVTGRVTRERRPHHIPDLGAVPNLSPTLRDRVNRHGGASLLYAPMLQEDRGLGSIVVVRWPPRPFSDREQALLQTFADQAAIAIENARLFRETQEALERRTATAEILKVIASSPSEVQPVFEAIATTANRLLGGISTTVWRFVDGRMFLVAFTPTNPAADKALRSSFPRPLADMPPFLPVLEGRTEQIADIEAQTAVPALLRDLGRLRGFRSILFTPLMSNGGAIGMISVTRREAGAFVTADVQLLRTFADQAVIAIENVRLFDEVQARTRDLTESLQQQTGTAEVLQVVSSSMADAQPVLDKILESCDKLFRSTLGMAVSLIGDDDLIHLAAIRSPADSGDPARDARLRAAVAQVRGAYPIKLSDAAKAAVQRIRHVIASADVLNEPNVPYGMRAAALKLGFSYAQMMAPLFAGDRYIGNIVVSREAGDSFTAKEQALLKTFADQAVIAIQNARLFNETQEALQQQTATSDILRVIASSPGDLQPVLDKLAETACRLCGAYDALVLLREGDQLRPAAHYGPIPVTFASQEISRGLLAGRAVIERRAIHIDDIAKYADEYPIAAGLASRGAAAGGMLWRANLIMPLMREGEAVGVIGLRRAEAVPFSDGQIDLLKTFSDQAVIAIENVRLFDEVQARTRDLTEALEHQTATSEVLSAISRSPTEVQPVFDAIARSATELCGATSGGVDLFYDGLVHLAAHYNWSPAALDAMRRIYPAAPGRGFASARAILTRSVVHIPDISEDPEYTAAPVIQVGFRSVLAVPMLRDGEPIGAIALVRLEPRPFTDRQVALLQTFAEQAVIAINNVRLFDEVQARTRDLTEALEQQTATAEVLKVISRSAFDLNLATSTILEAAARLCRAPLATLHLRDGEVCRLVTQFGLPEAFERQARENPIPVRYPLHSRRPARAGEVAHFPDAWNDPDYLYKATAKLAGYRAIVVIPLMRGDELVGIFSLGRPDPTPFTPSQIKLVQTFADQAAIAIENARMFGEVQSRTREVEEALAQQTATAEVLKVISRSAFDLQAVFDTLLASAVELTGAAGGAICMRQRSQFVIKSVASPSSAYRSLLGRTMPIDRSTPPGRALLSGNIELIADNLTDLELRPVQGLPLPTRSNLAVPLSRDGRVEGVISLVHPEPDAFTQRHIDLVQTFADQAVIAIENVRLFDEVQARTRDIEEALAQQTATADVLKVISRSAFDLQPVLDTLVESAARLCDTDMAFILRRDGEVFRAGAAIGHSPEYMEYLQSHPISINRGSVMGRVVLEGRVVQILDVRADPEYTLAQTTSLTGQRTALGVPLIRDGEVIGVIVLGRRRVEPYTARQIELVETFADQAVIAISNVGLFNATQESLAQQTATADVLKVISRSVSDVAPVFETILESCQRLLGLESVAVYLVEGEMVRGVAQRGWKGGDWGLDVTPLAGSSTGIAIAERRPLHFPDLADKPDLPEDKRSAVREAGGITVLYAPMLLEDRGVGSIVVSRMPARPFSEKEIALAQSFADQAAIAIQNARMFDEVQARTREVEEALAQQTATADVLKVISRSAFDLDVVFEALLASAVSLVGSRGGTICVREGDGFRYRAVAEGRDSAMWRYLSQHPPTPGRASVAGRVLLSGKPEIITDTLQDSEFSVPVHTLAGSRSVAGVPLLRDNRVEGALMVGRAEAGPFDPRQIEVLQTFADQAVIAIENVRLLDEVQARTHDLEESLAQQTATADVLKVISRSAFDLQVVFDTLLTSAVRLAGAAAGSMCVRDGSVFPYRAHSGLSPSLVEHLLAHPAAPGRGSTVDRVLQSGEVVCIPDVLEDPEYALPTMRLGTSMRSTLGVPLLRDDRVEGALVLVRLEPGTFHQRQIDTVKTFADQAVIAIENARLFGEVQARTKELAASLDDLRKAQDRLIQSEKLASLGQLTAGIAHEIKNPLNFVNNFSALSRELVGELAEVIKAAPLDESRREEADELIETIGGNLDKVVQHGKRADSIVKNMLLHSREGSGERCETNINPMVEEALNLAYHGMRAEKPGFNVTIVKSLDPNAGSAEVYAQEMTRVLLNLISNGFYATSKRESASGAAAYEPTISASTRDLGHSVEIAIRDNGIGIPDEVKAKMFNPFFTTKPAGEGTGLGLSLSHDIVVKQHGGTIEVATEPGAYTQFTIVLPRAGAQA
jgi:two-component system, NtrC family, sensor kinase